MLVSPATFTAWTTVLVLLYLYIRKCATASRRKVELLAQGKSHRNLVDENIRLKAELRDARRE